jgi:hypothetical protein
VLLCDAFALFLVVFRDRNHLFGDLLNVLSV